MCGGSGQQCKFLYIYFLVHLINTLVDIKHLKFNVTKLLALVLNLHNLHFTFHVYTFVYTASGGRYADSGVVYIFDEVLYARK